MHKHLLHIFGFHINVLNLLGHNVFALTQLEDVLLPVDNLECSIGKPLTNVACMMPSMCVDGLICSRWIFEVSVSMEIGHVGEESLDFFFVQNQLTLWTHTILWCKFRLAGWTDNTPSLVRRLVWCRSMQLVVLVECWFNIKIEDSANKVCNILPTWSGTKSPWTVRLTAKNQRKVSFKHSSYRYNQQLVHTSNTLCKEKNEYENHLKVLFNLSS